MQKKNRFPSSLIIIFSLFSGVLLLVVGMAYLRGSGSTGQEMTKMHEQRHQSLYLGEETADK